MRIGLNSQNLYQKTKTKLDGSCYR